METASGTRTRILMALRAEFNSPNGPAGFHAENAVALVTSLDAVDGYVFSNEKSHASNGERGSFARIGEFRAFALVAGYRRYSTPKVIPLSPRWLPIPIKGSEKVSFR